MSTVTLGGDRLGSGKKEKVHLRNYERSTHDLSYMWRSTMASGTLVPFMSEVALPGDTHEIKLNCDIKTHPTIGPLFGSYKVQLDVFSVPIRLYNGQLHMNKLGIGMEMQNIYLPQMLISADRIDPTKPIDNQQINPSSIFSYLGITGLSGGGNSGDGGVVTRGFNAIPFLAYWDIYKNYYANKQEEQGAVIHNPLQVMNQNNITLEIWNYQLQQWFEIPTRENEESVAYTIDTNQTKVRIICANISEFQNFNPNKLYIHMTVVAPQTKGPWDFSLGDIFNNWQYNEEELTITGQGINDYFTSKTGGYWQTFYSTIKNEVSVENEIEPNVYMFDLNNIDQMREEILKAVQQGTPFQVNNFDIEPYILATKTNTFNVGEETVTLRSQLSSQEGLALKTYQSDLFNNWISTEWIDGENGINEITKIDTSEGNFTIDELQLSKKIYDMLNRIAVSGGSYDDWLDATYTHERVRSIENPMYMGGLIKELTFAEVISNAEAQDQPLGTLAGRGVMTDKHKGGTIKIRTDEPSYIMGIISLTPRIDYSQGNKWDTNLLTMDDFHKPALDQIGFQDLITDQMAWWDTTTDGINTSFKSAGKQPAWINYMTNVNQVKGNFAIESDQMFMTLTRRYEPEFTLNSNDLYEVSIKDLTTYVDPVKFNHIFAYTKRDAQNFWAQIKVDITARRKMSAKVMPNL